MLCEKVLSSESMKPSKLRRHFETNHPHCSNKGLSYFESKAKRLKQSRIDSSGIVRQQSEAAVRVSFLVSWRIAKAKVPHTIAEKLIIPCAKEINRLMIGKEAENKLNILSLSDNTVQRRISLLSEDIRDQVVCELRSAGPFALQVD